MFYITANYTVKFKCLKYPIKILKQSYRFKVTAKMSLYLFITYHLSEIDTKY